MATLSPTSTPTPTSILFIPFPPEPEATHALTHEITDNVIFGSSSPECPLPCWQGLKVGYSTSTDVFTAFDRAFNFGGLSYVRVQQSEHIPDHYILYHAWEQQFENEPWQTSIFSVFAWVNRDTDKLEALSFGTAPHNHLDDTPFYPDLTLDKILKELGSPLYWYMKGRAGGQGDGAHIQFSSLIVYANGMSFYHSGELPTQLALISGAQFWTSQLCMHDRLEVNVRINRRLVQGFSQLSPFEARPYQIRIGMVPVEDIIGISSLELMERVEAETNPCIEIKLPQQ